LPKGHEADADVDTVVQPDVAVICDPNKLDEAGCRGAPDWIVEVLSPSTVVKDQSRKRALYEHHGVGEFWLVHPIDRVLTIYRLTNGAYGKPAVQSLTGETAVATLPGLSIRWREVESAPTPAPHPRDPD
jgi:Uma2 family endonuclease